MLNPVSEMIVVFSALRECCNERMKITEAVCH